MSPWCSYGRDPTDYDRFTWSHGDDCQKLPGVRWPRPGIRIIDVFPGAEIKDENTRVEVGDESTRGGIRSDPRERPSGAPSVPALAGVIGGIL